jgi:uncharacterized protein
MESRVTLARALFVTALLIAPSRPALGQAAPVDSPEVLLGVKIPLRDGTVLAGTLYRPAGRTGPLPTVLAMTPYISDGYYHYAVPIARRGYAVLVVDVRGRGSSEGTFDPFRQEAKDGFDTVEWIAKQPWCNGQVAMMGGSYGGFNQWTIAKEFPPHLVTITPTAASYAGIDFPAIGGIGERYQMRWISLTSGRTGNPNLFGDQAYWLGRFEEHFRSGVAYASLDSLLGFPSPIFQTWASHPDFDDYWRAMAPSPEDLARLTIPVFTRTGIYDADQVGALEHYRRHMQYGTAAARAVHYLMIGPWDHAGTRNPRQRVGGVDFGEGSIVDMSSLEADWFDWIVKGGKRPARLEKRVTYFVTGVNEWRYADDFDELGRNPVRYYLTSNGNDAATVFRSGTLVDHEPAPSAGDQWRYDPTDLTAASDRPDSDDLVDQSDALALNGRGGIYHTAPFERATEITGTPRAEIWLTMDVPDTDLQVSLFEITAEGRSIRLTDLRIRARYREGRDHQALVTPGEPTLFRFDRFRFVSREMVKGSRIRVVVQSPSSIELETNFNAGGVAARATRRDARTAHVRLLHQPGHWSSILLPLVR